MCHTSRAHTLTVKAMIKEMQPERSAGFLPHRCAWKAAGKGPNEAPTVIMEAMRDASRTVISRPRGFRFLSTMGSRRSATVFEDQAIAIPTAMVDKLTAKGTHDDRAGKVVKRYTIVLSLDINIYR